MIKRETCCQSQQGWRGTLLPWRWKQHLPLKIITSQKSVISVTC